MVLAGIAALLAGAPGTVISPPTDVASPTPSTDTSGTGLPAEADTWGAIWARANGVAVLRPTWLPKSQDDYQILPEIDIFGDPFFNYGISYYELHSVVGQIVWHVEFSANSLDGRGRGLQEFGGAPDAAMVRRHAAQLFGNGSPGWTLVWTEDRYRYAIQAFGVSREELLHIADSLAPVLDRTGRTTPTR